MGAWHILALNSEIDTSANSPQVKWMRADLAAHPTLCTLAMFHRPLFSSGPHGYDGSGEKARPLWQVLYENNADLILNGHDHDYERFAPQDPLGNADPSRGIREIVVGTGGATPYMFGKIKPNSEVRRAPVLGVLKLTLHESSYSWEFVPTTFLLFRDSGTDKCH
ncbi:MAG TPA: metallophosphoesterase [Anaerolineae bacterium]|nr:metallophosphoesterase [Anaerolineae bacterium]